MAKACEHVARDAGVGERSGERCGEPNGGRAEWMSRVSQAATKSIGQPSCSARSIVATTVSLPASLMTAATPLPTRGAVPLGTSMKV